MRDWLTMPHVASIGLEVHARSIKGCAFNPFTGEIGGKPLLLRPRLRRRLDPFYRVARGSLRVRRHRLPFCREPRCLGVDCVIGAVSKMQRPAADKRRKTDKRDAEFSAKQLALHEIVEVHVPDCECEGARDLSQAPADARERLPCYRQAAPLQVPAQEWAVPPRRRRPEKEARDVDQGALGLDRSRGDGRPHGPADPRLL